MLCLLLDNTQLFKEQPSPTHFVSSPAFIVDLASRLILTTAGAVEYAKRVGEDQSWLETSLGFVNDCSYTEQVWARMFPALGVVCTSNSLFTWFRGLQAVLGDSTAEIGQLEFMSTICGAFGAFFSPFWMILAGGHSMCGLFVQHSDQSISRMHAFIVLYRMKVKAAVS